MRKYYDKYKRKVVIYFTNLDITPEARNVLRKVRQYYINREKSLNNLKIKL